MFKKFNWGHGIVVALGTFIAFILFMIFVFPNGQQDSEMVSDHYYEDELNYQQIINAKKNADALGWKPEYVQDKTGIIITFPPDKTDANGVKFNLYRTDNKNLDVNKTVTLDAGNKFFIPAKVLTAGSYTLKVLWTQNKTPYQVDYELLWK